MSVKTGFTVHSHYPDTEIDAETDEMATETNTISVLVQYEHLDKILYKPFFIGFSLC